jgi:hypothetical protein
MEVREVYTPYRMAASGVICGFRGCIGGFLCTTSGTLQITDGMTAGGPDVLSSISVTAGTYYPLGFRCHNGAWAVLGTGAIGTFTVA